jgi:hypothetical protein
MYQTKGSQQMEMMGQLLSLLMVHQDQWHQLLQSVQSHLLFLLDL